MFPAGCALSAYGSALEIAFSANLLLTAWAGLYRLMEHHQADMVKKAEIYESLADMKETIAISAFKTFLVFWRRIQNFVWFFGLTCSAFSALFIYCLIWFFSPDTNMCTLFWQIALSLLAFSGPTLMILMAGLGWLGKAISTSFDNRLQQKWDESRSRFNKMHEKSHIQMYR